MPSSAVRAASTSSRNTSFSASNRSNSVTVDPLSRSSLACDAQPNRNPAPQSTSDNPP
jgi:hypothetical protein